MTVRQNALAQFRTDRAYWLQAAREHRAAGAIELCAFAVEGARIAQRNLLHVLRRIA
jgi:hypothetical protein